MIRTLAFIGFALAAPAVRAETARPTPAALQSAMAGHWEGALGYRDYQTDKLFELPVKTEIRAVADGVTIVRTSTYDDGPQTGLVWITSTMFFGKADALTTFVARKGRAAETIVDAVRVEAYRDSEHWTIVYERDGTDGDNPARIRTTEVRDGDAVLAKKDVLPASDAAKGWQFRNQLRLVRVR